MELIVRIIPEEDKRHFAAECNKCGWIGSSKDVKSDGTAGETGCSGDIYCPCCGTTDINEIDNEQPITTFIECLNKATDLVKVLTETIEGYDISKYIYTKYEEDNKAMAKELSDLKNNENFAKQSLQSE